LCINPKALSLVNCSFHRRIETGSQLQFATTPKEAEWRAAAPTVMRNEYTSALRNHDVLQPSSEIVATRLNTPTGPGLQVCHKLVLHPSSELSCLYATTRAILAMPSALG
jgi:hypothetical protein